MIERPPARSMIMYPAGPMPSRRIRLPPAAVEIFDCPCWGGPALGVDLKLYSTVTSLVGAMAGRSCAAAAPAKAVTAMAATMIDFILTSRIRFGAASSGPARTGSSHRANGIASPPRTSPIDPQPDHAQRYSHRSGRMGMTNRVSRRGLAGAAVLAPAALIGTAHAQGKTESTFERVTRTKVLRIAALPGEMPYFNKDIATGEWCRLRHRHGEGHGEDLGREAGLYRSPPTAIRCSTCSPTRSIIAFALNPTPQRALSIGFTQPMIIHPFGCVARKGFDPKTWDDLNKPEVRHRLRPWLAARGGGAAVRAEGADHGVQDPRRRDPGDAGRTRGRRYPRGHARHYRAGEESGTGLISG